MTIGLNKGGDPGSETIVLSIVNQKRPKNARKTILVAVCSYNKDKYPEVSAMMSIQSPRIDELLERGLDVRGERRPVRLLLSRDFESQNDSGRAQRPERNNAMSAVQKHKGA